MSELRSAWASTRTASRTGSRSCSPASTSRRAGARGSLRRRRDRHALIDAILGAAGKGDIGELFPSADPQWLDASSIRLLQRSYEVVRAAGFELVNADCVLIGERPKIANVRVAMGARLAGAMGVDIDRVTVRATTTDGLGFTGRGEGLAAHAVALLRTT